MAFRSTEKSERESAFLQIWQKRRLKKLFFAGQLTEEDIFDILAEEKANQREMVRIPLNMLQRFFPNYSPQQIQKAIVRMLEQKERSQKRSFGDDAR